MQDYINNSLPIQEADDTTDQIRRLFLMMIRYWYIVVAGLLGTLLFAFVYVKMKHQVYKVHATIVVPSGKQTMDLQSIFAESALRGGAGSGISNEVHILSSYSLTRGVIEDLDWETSWWIRRALRWDGLYGNEPISITHLNNGRELPRNIDFEIRVGTDDSFTIKGSGEYVVNGNRVPFDFSDEGTLGLPFKNDVLELVFDYATEPGLVKGNRYLFRFNSVNSLARSYRGKINAQLVERQSEIIEVSVNGTEPLREVHFINRLLYNYLEWKLNLENRGHERSLEFIDKQLLDLSDSVEITSNEFNRFRVQNQIIDLSMQGQHIMQQLNDIEKEILQIESQLEYLGNLGDYLQGLRSEEHLISPSVAGVQDPIINGLVVRMMELNNRHQVLRLSATESSRSSVLLDTEMNQVKAQLKENISNCRSNTLVKLDNLKRQNRILLNRLTLLPEKEQQLIDINRRYELMNDLYNLMLQKRAEFEIALASSVVNIHVLDHADLENISPTGLSAGTIYLIGWMLGLILPIGGIYLNDLLDNKIRMQEDVEKMTKINIIGHVLSNNSGSELPVIDAFDSPVTESFRSIRTGLRFLLRTSDEKVIGIHSINPREGKTFLSVNMAAILAFNQQKVLLIGADMRKPRIKQVLNINGSQGLSNYLSGSAALDDVLYSTALDNLWVIPSGPVPPNPSELLEHEQFERLIREVRERFEYVIIDNSPVSYVSDGFLTGRCTDKNIFVLRNNMSRKVQVKFINEIAEKKQLNKISIVINDVNTSRFGYYGYYAYKYSYRNYGYHTKSNK